MPVGFRRLTSESLAFAVLIGAASAMVGGYALDLSGLPMHPAVLALAALAGGLGGLSMFRGVVDTQHPTREIAIFAAVVGLAWMYLLWLASPSFLPVTIGPDVVHHLQLIHLIQHTHRLVHDPALARYLLEMADYTPGSHILAAAVGDWLALDALRILLPLTALLVSIKFGLLYLVAARSIRDMTSSVAPIAAPILALAPAIYTLGSFFHFFYYAQVVSETFAVGTLLAALGWGGTGRREYLWAFAACAVAAFLSWPPWVGIGCATLLFVVLRAPISWRARGRACTIAFAPLTVVAGVHTVLHAHGSGILTASGAVTEPSIAACGVAFLVCAGVGVIVSVRGVASAPVAVFLGVTLLQALALAALAALAHARSFYMPFKMIYLAVLPCAVLGATGLAWVAQAVTRHMPLRILAGVFPVLAAIGIVHGRVPVIRSTSPIQLPAYQAGVWARDHVNPACVDYFSRHWLTGYWLHLDVLGNPRLSDRMREESFEFRDVVGKWIEGRGLPFGIVEDLSDIPKELRPDLTVLQAFGSTAVVRNGHAAACQ